MATVKAGSKKEETRERIVRAAARAIRKHGYEGVGVADVMKEAGLTHGGFYAHFESRDALLAAAADQAGAESIESLTRAIAAAKPGQELTALVDTYLSDRHVTAPEQGCAIAAAGSEVPRQQAEVRRVAAGASRTSSASSNASSPNGAGAQRTTRRWASPRPWLERWSWHGQWTMRSFPTASARQRARWFARRPLSFFDFEYDDHHMSRRSHASAS